MDRIELEIISLDQSVTMSTNYAIVLKEKQGTRQIVVVIGVFEARAIAMGVEGMDTQRPLTHDLIGNILEDFDIQLLSVTITELKEGVFHSMLHFKDNTSDKEYFVDSRTSDAIAIAVRTNSPIYISEAVLQEVAIDDDLEYLELEEDKLVAANSQSRNLDDLPVKKLIKLMEEMIEKENYEEAAKIRDAIERKES